MSNTAYKSKLLQGLDQIVPVSGGLVPRSPVRWPPVGALMRAQDTVVATSRRLVAEWGISGSADWAQPIGADDPDTGVGVPNGYPDDTWRSLGSLWAHVTPGCELVAVATVCPSGIVQQYIVANDNWELDAVWGEVRVGVTWTNGANTTGPHYRVRGVNGTPAGDFGGQEAEGAGQNWSQTREVSVGRHRPPSFLEDPAVAVDYSEWSDVEIEFAIRGGMRLVHLKVYEQPIAHTTAHDDDGLTSVHAMPPSLSALTVGPMIRATQGATYEEHRHGSRRTMQVAERQSERLGPRIMHWLCYDESDTDIWAQAEGNPVTRASASFVHLLDSSIPIAEYGEDMMGWCVAGSFAQLARLCDPTCIARGRFAAVPIRVRVDAEQSAGVGTVRVQCGLYDWVDVTVAAGRALYTNTGIVESQVFADDANLPLVVWVGSTGGTLGVYSVSVDFGTWTS